MTNHIIDVSGHGGYLRCENGLLILERQPEPRASVPLPEVAAVVLAHRQITCTRAALAALASAGAAVIVCGDDYLPAAMMLPLTGYHAPARRLIAQAEASEPARKGLWRQVVQAKVRAQGAVLQSLHGRDFGLGVLVERVRSGDTSNIEGQAARIYWSVLFGDQGFRRDSEALDQNRYLNYGYAVLRAIVGRAICASGLHPGLGLHHHHRENAFCLADDLMEPFRPLVDKVVVEIVRKHGTDASLDAAMKQRLIQPLMGTFWHDGERTLFDLVGRLCASLGAAFEGKGKRLPIPGLDGRG